MSRKVAVDVELDFSNLVEFPRWRNLDNVLDLLERFMDHQNTYTPIAIFTLEDIVKDIVEAIYSSEEYVYGNQSLIEYVGNCMPDYIMYLNDAVYSEFYDQDVWEDYFENVKEKDTFLDNLDIYSLGEVIADAYRVLVHAMGEAGLSFIAYVFWCEGNEKSYDLTLFDELSPIEDTLNLDIEFF